MNNFVIEEKGNNPVVAICYDFDKTLSPDDMQAQGYIQSVGYNVDEFWKKSNQLAQENDMDQNLAYMLTMSETSRGKFYLTKDSLADYGSKVKLFNGVEEWFERITEYGATKGIVVEHYIISSGLKEMIEGTIMAKKGNFKKIYACSFYFDEQNVAKWPAQVINYTNKTQFLFRIEKGTLDVNDDRVNDYFPPEKIRVPFRNILYIGDSATDIPCMKLVNTYGGYSIGVYNPVKNDKSKVYSMMEQNRIRYFAPADYSVGSEIDQLVKDIIDRTACNEKLEKKHESDLSEAKKNSPSEVEIEKNNLIIALVNSRSFMNTHSIVSQMIKFDSWDDKQLELIYEAAVTNGQVSSILKDKDIKSFLKKLLLMSSYRDENARLVEETISN